jgi:hypothetical protein
MLSKNQIELIAKHLHELAEVFESTIKVPVNSVLESSSRRGRKPGAVSDDIRCQHTGDKGRCMNRATKGSVCGKHTKIEE